MSLIEKFERARYIVNTIGLSEVLDLVTVPSSKNKYDEYTDDLITELCDHCELPLMLNINGFVLI